MKKTNWGLLATALFFIGFWVLIGGAVYSVFKEKPGVTYSWEQQKQYKISWKSKTTDAKGSGKAIFTKDNAEEIAEEANRKLPEIEHTVTCSCPPVSKIGDNLIVVEDLNTGKEVQNTK